MIPQSFFTTIADLQFARASTLQSTPMPPNPHPMLAEAIVATITTVISAASAFLIAYVPESRVELLEWTLLPLIGATLAAGGAFCLNTQQEVRKIVVGRCLFALIVGVVGPRLLSVAHPALASILSDPFLKVGAGFIHGFLGYLLSAPFTKGAYDRATPIAAKLIQEAESKLVKQISDKVSQNVSEAAANVANTLASDPTNQSSTHTASVVASASKQATEPKQ